jgi:hypothetical protein
MRNSVLADRPPGASIGPSFAQQAGVEGLYLLRTKLGQLDRAKSRNEPPPDDADIAMGRRGGHAGRNIVVEPAFEIGTDEQPACRPFHAAVALVEKLDKQRFGLALRTFDAVKQTYDNTWVAVGETYPGPSARAKFTYEATSTSTVGVGYSISGAAGSYTQSGTSTVSSTTRIGWPDRLPNTKWMHRTTYQYKKFEIKDGGYCTDRWYQVRATAYQGGVNSYQIVGPPSATYCSPIGGPVVIDKDGGHAITWTNGVTLGPPILASICPPRLVLIPSR